MASIVAYGGIDEVGGNKFLLREEESSIMIDFGLSYRQRGKFFTDPFLRPRDLRVMLELGILPDIPGAYSREGPKPFRAVLLSHAHRDHAGHIGLLRDDIPIYAGEASQLILEAYKDMSRKEMEFYIGGKSIRKFHTGDSLVFDSIEISPVHVDHSVPGAYGFLIRTPSSVIAYSGDFRVHGPRSDMTLDFIDAMKKDRPDLLLVEHTNIADGEVSSETEVQRKLSSVVAECPSLVVGDFALADVDRYRSFYNAARESNRKLVISARRAYLLDRISSDPTLRLPGSRDGVCVLERDGVKVQQWEERVCRKWGAVGLSQISSHQRDHLLVIPTNELQGVMKIGPKPGSIFVFSSSEPFNEEMELDYERLTNWLDALGMGVYGIHVSGHAMPIDLRRLVKEVRPRVVVPMHGEHPAAFAKYIGDLGADVRIPVPGQKIVI